MSSYIKLDDGTQYRFQFGRRSSKAVLVNFTENELEKLLSLDPTAIVEIDRKRMTYTDARKTIGTIVAYIPNIGDWFAVRNYL